MGHPEMLRAPGISPLRSDKGRIRSTSIIERRWCRWSSKIGFQLMKDEQSAQKEVSVALFFRMKNMFKGRELPSNDATILLLPLPVVSTAGWFIPHLLHPG